MRNPKVILGWIALAVLVLFIVINFETVRINVLFIAHIYMPLSLVILGSALLGAGAAFAFHMMRKPPPKT